MVKTAAYRLTARDYVKLHLALTKRMRFFFRIAGILAAMAGMGLALYAMSCLEPEPLLQWGVLIWLLGLFGLTGSFAFFKAIRLRPESREFEKNQGEWVFEADGHGIRLRTEGTVVSHEWSAFVAWCELDGLLLFSRPKGDPVLLPAIAIDSSALEELRALARPRLPWLQL